MTDQQTEAHWFRIQASTLQTDAVDSFLRHPAAGGLSLFVGTTRQWTGERETVELAYDAYEAMAIKEMEKLVSEAANRWPILRAVMHHRTGVVPVGEASVIVGVATPHRAEAFDACRFLIDELKLAVPIWKKEHYADGKSEWVEPRQTN